MIGESSARKYTNGISQLDRTSFGLSVGGGHVLPPDVFRSRRGGFFKRAYVRIQYGLWRFPGANRHVNASFFRT